jgi:hypothetical protein
MGLKVAKGRPLHDPTVTAWTFHTADADCMTDMSSDRVAIARRKHTDAINRQPLRRVQRKEQSMGKKPKSERSDDRPTEDDIARASLGGERGSSTLPPAELDEKRKKDMPLERNDDPGHTA